MPDRVPQRNRRLVTAALVLVVTLAAVATPASATTRQALAGPGQAGGRVLRPHLQSASDTDTPTATSTATPDLTATAAAAETMTAIPTSTATLTPTPTDTPVVRETLTPSPTPTPVGSTQVELIQNGGFESGLPPWQFYSAGNYFPLSTVRPHTGTNGVWMCSGNNCNDQVWQTVTVPTNLQTARLSYWLNVQSSEPSGSCSDTFIAALWTASGTPISTVTSYCSGTPTNGWMQMTADVTGALFPYAGQQVRVHFQGLTNGSLPSNFYLDDVSLQASYLLPTLTPTPAPPTLTPTATLTPTMTATPVPSIQITGLSLLRGAHGAVNGSCNTVLAGAQSLVATHLLAPNQTGLLRANYQTTGSGTVSGRVIYTESGHAVDGSTLVPGAKGSITFLCARASFSGSKATRLTAKVTLTYGSASQTKSMSFYVGKCANGTTGSKGTCIACKTHYKLYRGTCRRASQKQSVHRARQAARFRTLTTQVTMKKSGRARTLAPSVGGRAARRDTFKLIARDNLHL